MEANTKALFVIRHCSPFWLKVINTRNWSGWPWLFYLPILGQGWFWSIETLNANAVTRNILNFLGQNRWGPGSVSLSWLSVFQVSNILVLHPEVMSATRVCFQSDNETYLFLPSFQWGCSPCFASFRWQSGQRINTAPTYENSRIIQVFECQLFLFCCKKKGLIWILHGTSRRKSS